MPFLNEMRYLQLSKNLLYIGRRSMITILSHSLIPICIIILTYKQSELQSQKSLQTLKAHTKILL